VIRVGRRYCKGEDVLCELETLINDGYNILSVTYVVNQFLIFYAKEIDE